MQALRLFTFSVAGFLCMNAKVLAAVQSDTVGKSDGTTLSEVKVLGTKARYSFQDNALVYNVENDKGARLATSAADILRRVPMVTVGIGDAPMIQGNTNIKILVNGKELYGVPNNQILSLIPPSSIVRVEVTTMPGAKYSAEGNYGAINIITSQKKEYLSGAGNMGVGNKGSHLASTLISPLTENLSLQANLYALVGYSSIGTQRQWTQDNRVDIWKMQSTGNNLNQLYNGGFALNYTRNMAQFNLAARVSGKDARQRRARCRSEN